MNSTQNPQTKNLTARKRANHASQMVTKSIDIF